MRPISLSLALASTSIVADEVKFNPPEEWIEQAVPSPLPSPLTYLKKVASEDQFIQVTVSALPSVDSSAAANEVTAGQISGMKKGGFVEENVTDIVVSGFPAKQIIGEFRSDDYEGVYLVDNKVVFSDEATVSVSVSVYDHDARGEMEVVPPVLDWVSFPGSPAVLADSSSSVSRNFSIGEKIGSFVVYGVIGFAFVAAIRHYGQKKKAE